MRGSHASKTALSPLRIAILRYFAEHCLKLDGEFWECGVYRGGSARILADIIAARQPLHTLRLFDTFCGLPLPGPHDGRGLQKGFFRDTSLAEVKNVISESFVSFCPGMIPETFKGLEDTRIAFAHIDVDLYQSTWDCLEFIYPRLVIGGKMLVDDYKQHVGCKKAVLEFSACHPECIVEPPHSQAVVSRRV